MSIILAVLALGLLIVVHELGHMLVARRMGMRVEKFSVGFGPVLARWRGKETTFQIALIPLGGYVQIAGMNPNEQLPEGDPGSYANKSPWARSATILAGPLTNYLFAIVIMTGVILVWGLPQQQHMVKAVEGGTPAQQGGMHAGDTIVGVGGRPVRTVEDILERIQASRGRPLAFVVRREGREVSLSIAPRRQEEGYRIGIQFGQQLSFIRVGPGEALLRGVVFPIDESRNILTMLGRLFTRKVGVDQVGGPLEIVRQLKMSFEQSLVMALIVMGLLNVFLGLFNLLPVPALDGGRLLFLLYTLLTRRPVNQRIENLVHTVGFLLLFGLIILLTYRDVARLVGRP